MTTDRWRIRLARLAEADYVNVLAATTEKFGPRQADIYEGHLLNALMALQAGPDLLGSIARPEIRPDLRIFHIRRLGVPGRHLICYRVADGQVVEVLRILHDAMDLRRHIAPQSETPDTNDV